MALSGSNTLQMDSRNQVRSIVEWSATQNIVDNTSTITVKVYTYFVGAIYSTAQADRVVDIAGQVSTIRSAIGNHPNGAKVLVATVTKTVAHNSIGELSTKIKVTNPFRVTYAGQYINQAYHEFTINLNKIDRESTLTVTALVTIPNSSPSVNIVAQNSSFRHIADLRVNGVKIKTLNNIAAGAHSFALSTAQMDQVLSIMKNTTSMEYEVVISTWNKDPSLSGAKRIGGYPRAKGTLTVSSTLVPVINAVTHEETNATLIDNGIDVYVNGMSRVRIKTNASGVRGSAIKSIEVSSGGKKYYGSDITTDTVMVENVAALPWGAVIKVTDTRNRTASMTVNHEVVEYNNPILTIVKPILRVRSDYSSGFLEYVPDKINGNLIGGELLFTVSSLNERNRPWSLVVEIQQTGTNTWEEVYSDENFSSDEMQLGGRLPNSPIFDVGVSPLFSYVLRCTIVDKIGSSQFVLNVPSGFTIMDFNATGLGMSIGKPSEMDAFEVAMPAVFHEDVTFSEDGEVELVFENGFKLYGGSYDKRAVRVGNVVFVDSCVSPPADNNLNTTSELAANVIATLPVGFRPKYRQDYVFQGSGTNIWLCIVFPDGRIMGARYRSGETYSKPPATAWMPFNFSFNVE